MILLDACLQQTLESSIEKTIFYSVSTKTLSDEQSDLSASEIRETDLFNSMKSMEKTKTSSNV